MLVDKLAVLDVELHVVALKDRRQKPWRMKRWVFSKSLEQVLFGVRQSGTGAISKLLARVSMQGSTICLGGASVKDDLVTEEEFDAVLTLFRSTLHIEARGRTRNVTLVPVSGDSGLPLPTALRVRSFAPARWCACRACAPLSSPAVHTAHADWATPFHAAAHTLPHVLPSPYATHSRVGCRSSVRQKRSYSRSSPCPEQPPQAMGSGLPRVCLHCAAHLVPTYSVLYPLPLFPHT